MRNRSQQPAVNTAQESVLAASLPPGLVSFQLLIAFLPRVSIVNGSRISKQERITAERNAVRHFYASPTKPRRVRELLLEHGEVLPLAQVQHLRTMHFKLFP